LVAFAQPVANPRTSSPPSSLLQSILPSSHTLRRHTSTTINYGAQADDVTDTLDIATTPLALDPRIEAIISTADGISASRNGAAGREEDAMRRLQLHYEKCVN
jgi:hypothetical protein